MHIIKVSMKQILKKITDFLGVVILTAHIGHQQFDDVV